MRVEVYNLKITISIPSPAIKRLRDLKHLALDLFFLLPNIPVEIRNVRKQCASNTHLIGCRTTDDPSHGLVP